MRDLLHLFIANVHMRRAERRAARTPLLGDRLLDAIAELICAS